MSPTPKPKPKPKSRSMVSKAASELFSSINKGIRSLATPKGIVAGISIVVSFLISLVAYIKASYIETSLYLLFTEPIVLESGAEKSERGPNLVNDFEAFLITEGVETVYTTDMKLNIVAHEQTGVFDAACNYKVSTSPSSARLYDPYIMVTRPLTTNYLYQLRSGAVIPPNSILPISSHLQIQHNSLIDGRLSAAIGATRTEGYDQRVLEILRQSSNDPEIDICISGTAFTSGGEAKPFKTQLQSVSGGLEISYSDQQIDAIPASPGGTPQPAVTVRQLFIRGPRPNRAIRIFMNRKLKLF